VLTAELDAARKALDRRAAELDEARMAMAAELETARAEKRAESRRADAAGAKLEEMRAELQAHAKRKVRSELESLRAELPEDEVLECSPEEVQDVARRVEVVVPIVARVGEDALASPCLRLVQQFGAGLDVVDIDSASRHGRD
jgi:seryl-tRNA synthetase